MDLNYSKGYYTHHVSGGQQCFHLFNHQQRILLPRNQRQFDFLGTASQERLYDHADRARFDDIRPSFQPNTVEERTD